MSFATDITSFLTSLVTNPGQIGNITDTNGNIVSNLNALNLVLPSIGSITSSNGRVTVGVSALSADQGVLDKVTGGVAISDTVSNIVNALPLLTSDSNVVSVASTDGQVGVSVAAFRANQGGLDKLTGGFIVMDTAANISANLDQLAADPVLLSVTITDNNPVVVSVAQLTSDASTFAKFSNANQSPYQLAVVDKAANIVAGLSRLQAAHASIARVTPTDGLVSVPVSGFSSNQAILDKITGGFRVTDTVKNLTAAIASMAADSKITSVMSTDGPASLSVADFQKYRTLADKNVVGFNIVDTAAHVQGALATLSSDPHVGAITATGGPVVATLASLAANKVALDKIVGGFAVTDTAAAVQAGLASLAADSHVASIAATGGKVVVPVASFLANRSALDKIVGGFAISDTAKNISAAQAAIQADKSVASIVKTPMAQGDLNGDGISDIVWQATNGSVDDWTMSNYAHAGNTAIAPTGWLPPTQWALIGTDDYNGDGTADLLWQNQQTGAVYEWGMVNASKATNIALGSLPKSEWDLIGTGDFNGDGTTDLLWQNKLSGSVYEWTMVDGQHTADTQLAVAGALPQSQWAMIGKGDFNGDGTTDLLWQNKQSGAVYEWGMQNGQRATDIALGTMAPATSSLIGAGDFNGDRTTDLLWQNTQTGALSEWVMQNSQHAGTISLGTLSTSEWHLVTTGDFSGKGTTDIVWQNQQNGALYDWGMSNGQHVSDTALGTLAPADWQTLSTLKT